MKRSLTREIHNVQLISILVFGLIFMIMTVTAFWDRTVQYQQELLLSLNKQVVASISEPAVIEQTVQLQNNGQTKELGELLTPLIQKTLNAFPRTTYRVGYYSTPIDKIVAAGTNSPQLLGVRLDKKDPGRKIWVTKHYLFLTQWSLKRKSWVLKCYYPILYKGEVIGQTFSSVNLWGIGSIIKERLLNFIIILLVGLGVTVLIGKKATKRIKRNIHRLAMVEPQKKLPPFDYVEFDKVAETNHKVFDDLVITEKAKSELLTNFPWGFCIINSNGILVNINNKGLDLLGTKRDAVLHRGISALGREFTSVLRAFHEKRAIETEVALSNGEGEKIILLVNAFPVTINSEETGAMACFIDVTGQRKMQSMLEHMNRLSTVGEMISIIVHDIRNPLAVIKALSQLCYMKPEANYRLNCKKIDKLTEEINAYLGKILTFAQPANDTAAYSSIKEMFENVLILLQGKLNAAQVTVESWIADPEPHVYVNQLDCQYALYTLLNTSKEHLKGPGKIGFQADYSGDLVQIEITDSGNGLSEKELNRIWDTSGGVRPTGINVGLAMSKRLIEKFNGTLTVKTEAGRGTVFTVTLPSAKSDQPDQRIPG